MIDGTLCEPLDLDAKVEQEAAGRVLSSRFADWSQQVEACNYCSRPVRLVGSSQTVDLATGEVLSSYASSAEPDGVTYVRCNNRRASVCPSCSREYAGDMWHLIRAGTAGGDKGVPNSVREHPKVFATLTAPSFGAVHVRKKPGSSGSHRCRPRRTKTLCPHGRPTWCTTIHDDHDGRVGQPLCADCYDYETHIVWQWWAPELWRRFTIAMRRLLAARLGLTETAARRVVSMPFGKITEYQLRGAVHFHAVIRLDGPTSGVPFGPPLVAMSSTELAGIVRDAVAAVYFDAPALDDRDVVRRLRFGRQVDARAITRHLDDDRELSEEAVAGYLAKYVTKATDDLDPGDRAGRRNPHVRALSETVEVLAGRARTAEGINGPYGLLGRYERALGFRGHCASKSRTFSTTMGALRRARRTHARRQVIRRRTAPAIEVGADLGYDEDDTTEVIGSWTYAGIGWMNRGDAALAAMAAAQARERVRRRSTRSQLAAWPTGSDGAKW